MIRTVLAALLALAAPAGAHRRTLFATVEDGVVSGSGFFVGGGRPTGARVVARDAAGAIVFEGATGPDGAFSFRPPAASGLEIVLDVGDGHAARARIDADRLRGSARPEGAYGEAAAAPPTVVASFEPGVPPPPSADELRAMIDAAVAAAVAREVRPLAEALSAAEARVRFNDVAGGIGMIVGLAGIALWARSRRR